GGERPPSPVPEEQTIQSKDDDKKTEEERDHTTAQKHSRDEDTSVEPGESDATQQSTLSPALDTPVEGHSLDKGGRSSDPYCLSAARSQSEHISGCVRAARQQNSQRFRDLMRLFHTSASQASSEDEAAEQQSATDEEQD
ncbi:hypothetical protein M9458_032214, partial [Cirrhinus mrigala]